ncbi:MAG: sigma factor-like helix-turn-helix DNA-binding protein [Pseudomonadota bacterium]
MPPDRTWVDTPSPVRDVANDQLEIINVALRAMPEKRWHVFVLHRLDGKNLSAVAPQLGVSRSAAAKHLVRAMEDIDRTLEDGRLENGKAEDHA